MFVLLILDVFISLFSSLMDSYFILLDIIDPFGKANIDLILHLEGSLLLRQKIFYMMWQIFYGAPNLAYFVSI